MKIMILEMNVFFEQASHVINQSQLDYSYEVDFFSAFSKGSIAALASSQKQINQKFVSCNQKYVSIELLKTEVQHVM